MKTNVILAGDNSEVLKGFEPESIDLSVTSPPYDNLRSYKGFSFNFQSLAFQLFRVAKNGGLLVWIVDDETKDGARSCTSYRQLLYFVDIGFQLYEDMVYKKNTSGYPPSNHYENVAEKMFVLSKGKPKTINLLKDKKNKWTGTSNFGVRTNRQQDGSLKERGKSMVAPFGIRQNIWEYPTGKGYSASDDFAYQHPAIFPEALARDHILSWSNEGDIVLDPFSGSGTTLKMAKMLSRQYIGIDISPEYVTLAEKRLLATNVPLFGQGRGLTPREPDNGESAPSQAFSTPDTLFDLEGLS